MDIFGNTDPKKMPGHLFWNCRHLDYDSAVRADISKQNFSVCPRHWYVDAIVRCDDCGSDFCFTAVEQKVWYEDSGFWIDSFPRRCQTCRSNIRRIKALRQEYDRDIAAVLRNDDLEAKERMAELIDQMCATEANLPERILENRKRLAKQIAPLRVPSFPGTG